MPSVRLPGCAVFVTLCTFALHVRSAETSPPPRTIAEEAVVLASGRLSARQRAFARLAVHPDRDANALLAAQFDLYLKGELLPALWLDLLRPPQSGTTPA